jgi:hypothetical protein
LIEPEGGTYLLWVEAQAASEVNDEVIVEDCTGSSEPEVIVESSTGSTSSEQ